MKPLPMVVADQHRPLIDGAVGVNGGACCRCRQYTVRTVCGHRYRRQRSRDGRARRGWQWCSVEYMTQRTSRPSDFVSCNGNRRLLERNHNQTRRAEPVSAKRSKDGADSIDHCLVWMKQDLAVGLSPNKAGRHAAAQLAAGRLVTESRTSSWRGLRKMCNSASDIVPLRPRTKIDR